MKRFYQTINQAWSKRHGKHRRTNPASHSDPAVGTDHGTGGTAARDALLAYPRALTIVADPRIADEPAPAVPYAGIRTGELIGHRLWWLLPCGHLSSLAHRRVWVPGETVYGDVDKAIMHDEWIYYPIWGGVYSFASRSSLSREVDDLLIRLHRFKTGQATWMWPSWNPYRECEGVVTGTIKMWGEVIECEHGYRAEYAKLTSIIAVHGQGDVDALRAKYGV